MEQEFLKNISASCKNIREKMPEMEQEQVEIQDFGIGIWQFRDIHFVRARTEWQKNLLKALFHKCSSTAEIYSDLGNEKDWNLFLNIYDKLTEKVGERKNDRTLSV